MIMGYLVLSAMGTLMTRMGLIIADNALGGGVSICVYQPYPRHQRSI
jgi:hypothetical protein